MAGQALAAAALVAIKRIDQVESAALLAKALVLAQYMHDKSLPLNGCAAVRGRFRKKFVCVQAGNTSPLPCDDVHISDSV